MKKTEGGALPIAQQRIYALLPLVAPGFATFLPPLCHGENVMYARNVRRNR